MNKQLLLEAPDKIILEVLKLLREDSEENLNISTLQAKLCLGYGRAYKLKDVLEAAEIISDGHKYKMVTDEEGKRHRQYIPSVLIVSADELDECIAALEAAKL